MNEQRRKVDIKFQRQLTQTITRCVAVPTRWNDEEVEKHLSKIYKKVNQIDFSWDTDDIQEGTHELLGKTRMPFDLIYIPEKDG